MESFTVQVFPVAQPDAWRAFCKSAADGEHAEAHRAMLRRLGVKREHIYGQAGPEGQIMVLVWEGMNQGQVAERMGELLQDPQSDHERYIATHVIPVIHGVDPTAGPPPEIEKVATIES